MNDIKFIEIIPDSGALGTKIIYINDSPEGMSFRRKHISPRSPRRLQNGTLVTQAVRYNKKEFSLAWILYEITIHTYLESLYESGIGATLKVWYEDSSDYSPTTEFNGSVSFIDYNDDGDQTGNKRNINAVFAEV
jgi:hypothetical protein